MKKVLLLLAFVTATTVCYAKWPLITTVLLAWVAGLCVDLIILLFFLVLGLAIYYDRKNITMREDKHYRKVYLIAITVLVLMGSAVHLTVGMPGDHLTVYIVKVRTGIDISDKIGGVTWRSNAKSVGLSLVRSQ
jgi:hypothetical protein